MSILEDDTTRWTCGFRSHVLALWLFAVFSYASLSPSVSANDLVIEDFSVTMMRAGQVVFPPAAAEIVWQPVAQSLVANIDAAVSWDCEASQFNCLSRKPEFSAIFELVALESPCPFCFLQEVDSFQFAPVTFSGTEVRYRNIPFIGQGSESRQFAVAFSGGGVEQWIAEQINASRLLRARLRIDIRDLVMEDNELNNDSQLILPRLLPIGGSLRFGPTETLLTNPGTVTSDSAVCGSGSGADGTQANVRLQNAATVWIPGQSGIWSAVDVPLASMCARYSGPTASGLDLRALNSINAGDIALQWNGLDVRLIGNLLNILAGARPSFFEVDLPSPMTAHSWNAAGNSPATRGSRILTLNTLTTPAPQNYDNLAFSGDAQFLQSEGLPFALNVQSLGFVAGSLSGQYASSAYAYDLEYTLRDNRHLNNVGPRSNDRRFLRSRFTQSDRSFSVTAAGLQVGNMDFASDPRFIAHYPRLAASTSAFSASVRNGRFELRGDISQSEHYRFDLSADCAACTSGGPQQTFDLHPVASEGLAEDGAMLVRVSNVANVRFGPWDDDQSRYIFERLDDAGTEGVLFLPGGIAEGGNGVILEPANYLLGSRLAQAAPLESPFALRPAAHFARNHIGARRGNGFMPGLTLGPEFYSQGADKQPVVGDGYSLTGSRTRIGFGGLPNPAYHEVAAAPATKLVIRPAGVTGAFNTAVPPQPQVYGYPLLLDRFAFRLTSNILDPESWLDGRIAIPGRGDFDVVFESLALNCSGDVGEGLIVHEERSQRLGAWQTDVELLAMSFEREDPAAPICPSQDRRLLLGKTAQFMALDDPLGILAFWTPAGDPEDAELSGKTDRVLDRPKGQTVDPAEDMGFALALDRTDLTLDWAGSATTDAWLALTGEIGVPFWNALNVDARIANDTPSQQMQSIVVHSDSSLTDDDGARTNEELAPELTSSSSADTDARYDWGATGFGIELPVHFEPGRHSSGNRPRFLGRTRNRDLVIIKANSGIDYIRPDETKLSFGASADFERMRVLDIDLHIAPYEHGQLSRVDARLCVTLNFCTNFFESQLGSIFSTADELNRTLGTEADEALEDALREQLADELFARAAEDLAIIRSLPERVAAITALGIQEEAGALFVPLDDTSHDDDMRFSYEGLPQLYIAAEDATANASDISINRDRLTTAINKLDLILYGQGASGGLTDLNNFAAERITTHFTGLRQLLFDNADSEADRLIDRLNAIESAVDDLALEGCPSTTSPAWALADSGGTAFTTLLGLLKGLTDAGGVIDFAQSVSMDVNEDEDFAGLEAFFEEYDAQIDYLSKIAGGLQSRLNTLCNTEGGLQAALLQVTDDADQLIADLLAAVAATETAFDVLEEALLAGADDAGVFVDLGDSLGGHALAVAGIRQVLARHLENVNAAERGFPSGAPYAGLTVGEIQSRFDSEIDLATDGAYAWFYPANETPAHSFVSELNDALREPVDQSIAFAAQQIDASLTAAFLGYPRVSGPELETLIVNRLLNSDGIEQLLSALERVSIDDMRTITDLPLLAVDMLNSLLQILAERIEDGVGNVLADATGFGKNNLPLQYVKLDGFAVIAGNELDRLHLQADWAAKLSDSADGSEFSAAMDVTRWNSNGKDLSCVNIDSDSLLDATMSFYSAPMSVWNAGTQGKNFFLGFVVQTLRDEDESPVGNEVKGAFGGVSVGKKMDFGSANSLKPSNINLAFMLSKWEHYLAGNGNGSFQGIDAGVSFLLGNTCDTEIITLTVPDVGEFIALPENKFRGVIMVGHGGLSIPLPEVAQKVIKLGVDGRYGFWFLLEGDSKVGLGGLYGGAVYGKLLKLGGVRGQFQLALQKSGVDLTQFFSSTFSTDGLNFGGELWGAAGTGFCNPKSWTSIAKVREDSLCGTVDAGMGVFLQQGFVVGRPAVTGVR